MINSSFQEIGKPLRAKILKRQATNVVKALESSYAKYFNNSGVKNEAPATLCNFILEMAKSIVSTLNTSAYAKLSRIVS